MGGGSETAGGRGGERGRDRVSQRWEQRVDVAQGVTETLSEIQEEEHTGRWTHTKHTTQNTALPCRDTSVDPTQVHWLASGLGKHSQLSYQQDVAWSATALGLQGHEGLCVTIVTLSHTRRFKPSLPLQKNKNI